MKYIKIKKIENKFLLACANLSLVISLNKILHESLLNGDNLSIADIQNLSYSTLNEISKVKKQFEEIEKILKI